MWLLMEDIDQATPDVVRILFVKIKQFCPFLIKHLCCY